MKFLQKKSIIQTEPPIRNLSQQSRHKIRGKNGRFEEGINPPCKQINVSLPAPLIESLDEYGREHGTGRGKSLQRLLEGILEVKEPEVITTLAEKDKVRLELTKTSNPLYIEFRKKHYIPNRGVVGQQLQYLIFYDEKVVGVIGGASAVFKTQKRDQYLGLSEDRDTKTRQLNSIINNNIFKLDYSAPNLATIVLKKWRKQIAKDWETLYGVEVAAFETFVVEERLWNGKTRNGACYRADNWKLVGLTKGYGKTNTRGRTHNNKLLKSQKLIYCLRLKNKKFCTEYTTCWNDPVRQKEITRRRNLMLKDHLDFLLDEIKAS